MGKNNFVKGKPNVPFKPILFVEEKELKVGDTVNFVFLDGKSLKAKIKEVRSSTVLSEQEGKNVTVYKNALKYIVSK